MYAFSKDAKKIWKKIKISDLNENIIKYCVNRIIDTIKDPKNIDFQENKESYLYPVAKLLLSKKPSVLKKFAEKERERVLNMLKSLDPEDIFSVFLDVFDCYYDEEYFYVDVLEYIRKTDGLNKRAVYEGNVIIRKYHENKSLKKVSEDVIESICDHVYLLLKDPIKEVPSEFQNYVSMFNNLFFDEVKEITRFPLDLNKLPPCIKKIYFDLVNGENVPHMARFVIATFFINIGVEKEKIVDLFRNQENFNEKRTIYHIEYLMGERGCGKRRMCPNCDKIKEYGLCISNCGVKNPLVLYKRNIKNSS